MQLDIRGDFGPAKRYLDGLAENLRNKALARALNEVGRQTKTKARQEIVAEFNLKASDVSSMLFVEKAKPRFDRLAVSIQARSKRGRSLNVIRFVERSVTLAQAKKRRKAGTQDRIFVKIKRDGGTKMLSKPKWAASMPFILTNKKSGGTFVAARTDGGRYSIQGVQTVDVPSMFNTKRINSRLLANIRLIFPTILKREIDAVLRGH